MLANYIIIDPHANFFIHSIEFRQNIDTINLKKRAVRSLEEPCTRGRIGVEQGLATCTDTQGEKTVQVRLSLVRQKPNVMFNK